jgi:hypothetical protein
LVPDAKRSRHALSVVFSLKSVSTLSIVGPRRTGIGDVGVGLHLT